MILAFGVCELDIARRELRRDGAPVHVEPQVFDLLVFLAGNPDRVISKDELLDAVWRGRIVSEATLTSRVSAARRAIGDRVGDPAILRTIARRGFRFAAAVTQRAVATSGQAMRLGVPSTHLLGREKDMAGVIALLRGGARLVTLSNIGGVGKTRLALAVAAELEAGFADGTRLVELAGVGHPEAVVGVIASALGVTQQPNRSLEECVIGALRPREHLLIIDNCEHVIDAVAALIRTILSGCPKVAILATSREVLAMEGERVWIVPPLDCAGATSPAVRLFMERAQAIAPNRLMDSDAATVEEVCRHLDGLPLAIELAAARVVAMSPRQIRAGLDERFRLLTGAPRGAEPRHRTLFRAVEWSFDLLSQAERALLARLSVFAGGFTLDAATEVCAGDPVPMDSVLDLLDSLVRKSLLTANRLGVDMRYGVLETVRQFGQRQLDEAGESETFRLRHAAYFADAADANFDRWLSPDQREAYLWLDLETDNLRAAFHWARLADEVDIAARIASDTGDMARFRLHDEPAVWASQILDAARAIGHRRLVILLTWTLSNAWALGRLDEAKRYAFEAITLLDDRTFDPWAWVYTDLAMISSFEGDRDAAIRFARAAAAHPADQRGRFCLAMLPSFLALNGYADEAIAASVEAIAGVEATGIPGMMSIALWGTGKAYASRDRSCAAAALERAEEIAGSSGNLLWEVTASLELAALQARGGDAGTALAAFRRLMERWRHSRDLVVVAHGLGALAVLFERLNLLTAAATLHGAVTGAWKVNPFVPEVAEVIPRLRDRMGAADFAAAAEKGAAMAAGKANDYALELIAAAIDALGDDRLA
jgi:predicted ATPase/DNA-binding winged helix-turn-helix (wHTH) protein